MTRGSETADGRAEGDWVVVVDPAWTPDGARPGGQEPPAEAMIGGWLVGSDGSPGPFRPNPGYRPSEPGSPTTPVDAAARLAARGAATVDVLLHTLASADLGVALDERGVAVVAPAPDGMPCVLVASAPAHRAGVPASGWQDVTLRDLVKALPGNGVDVLLDPSSPASTRLAATALRQFLAEPAASRTPGAG
jgi:hypothetical protein